jgi:hypothetical protein
LARDQDILFVVEDTPLMAPAVAGLEAGFRSLAEDLAQQPFGLHSNHVAVIPAAIPDGSCQPQGPRGRACGAHAPDVFLTTGPHGTVPNFPGRLPDALACLGDLGAGGCGAPQAFEAARLALSPPGGLLRKAELDFLRPGAILFVAFVVGEDDASMEADAPAPISRYVEFLSSLKANPDDVLVGAVGPWPIPPRLLEFLTAAQGTYASIATADGLPLALLQLFEHAASSTGAGPAPSRGSVTEQR